MILCIFLGFRRSDEIFQQPYYFDPNRHLHTKYAKFHPTYIKFVEDAMLVLFLLCVLITLLVVHRGSCYRLVALTVLTKKTLQVLFYEAKVPTSDGYSKI